MSFNDLTNFRNEYGVDNTEVSDALVIACLNSAYRQIAREVSEEAFNSAVANGTEIEKLIRADLAEAEAYLTCGRIVERTGLQIRQRGMIIQEHDGTSGLTDGKTVVNQYLSPEKLARYAQAFYDKAKPLLSLYAAEEGQSQIDLNFLINFTEETETEF